MQFFANAGRYRSSDTEVTVFCFAVRDVFHALAPDTTPPEASRLGVGCQYIEGERITAEKRVIYPLLVFIPGERSAIYTHSHPLTNFGANRPRREPLRG